MTEVSTQDMNLAAFFWSQPESRLVKLAPKLEQRRNVFKFVFELNISKEELSKLTLDYQNGKALVDPVLFVQKQNHLRDQLRAAGSR